jgi:hypothetical protein
MTRHKLIISALALLTIVFTAGSNSGAQTSTMMLAQAAAAQPMTYADLEHLYLDGKISAKQYQRLLNEMKSRPAPPPVATPGGAQAVPGPVQTNRSPVLTTSDEKINQVENKMDELIKAKAAREKAITNAPPRTAAGPRTKRERLNDLLRLYIEGKITEPELNERRAKILAEPEP